MPSEIVIAAVIVAILLVGLECGFRLGRRTRSDAGTQVGTIQGATLGLLALLLGFSFAGAAARYMERQDLIIQEANAIGTAFLRAELLPEPARSALQNSLAEYVDHRITVSQKLRHGLSAEDKAKVLQFHADIWKAASEGVAAQPTAIMPVLNPVNEVLDLHASRVAAARKHLPSLVMVLLVVCSLLAMAVIGYGCGVGGRRSFAITGPLVILIAAALWTTIDLDYPRAGLIRLDDYPLMELNLKGVP